ncbi:TPA: ethanolamine ammonia-lyase subunit EutC [Serratia marcescens]|nr:ethanolamine ammonia-lyase subunit EutC [Serratia marcescens]HAT5031648.1 ethanolamine ammonia-lyase subunit EutC [Serratia marcescens]
MSKPVHANSWDALRAFTYARIALGRTGASLPTNELLRFGLAHAQARDAVHQPFDSERLAADLRDAGWPTLAVHSQAADRAAYLRRPDLGRRLAPDSRSLLLGSPSRRVDLLLIVADGLSSKAVHRQALPLLQALRPYLDTLGLTVAPVVLAHQARVALGDEIGEWPGLSSPDSLGVYLTWGPNARRTDAERNCISNVRPEGLDYPQAAFRLAWLLEQAFLRRLSGIELKDESDNPALHGRVTPLYPQLGG